MRKVALNEDEWFIVSEALRAKKLKKEFSIDDVTRVAKKINDMY